MYTSQASGSAAPSRPFAAEIARPRVIVALSRPDYVPIRILCGPNGSGKTTVLRQYAALGPHRALIKMPPRATRAQVLRLLEGAANAAEIIIDDADVASADGIDALLQVSDRQPGAKRYLFSGISRTRMQVQRLLPSGVAELFDGSLLAFNCAEIGQLAEASGVPAEPIDVEQLLYETDGWPVAVSWIIRDAARNGRSLKGAFEQWRERNGHLLVELVALSQPTGASMQTFAEATRTVADPESQRTLARLDADGFPIVRMRAHLRPYRVLMRLLEETPDASAAVLKEGLSLKLFGRFTCTIGNRPVTFTRRRDQSLLTFVALAPRASVTRAELVEAFWHDALPAVASQGLRTALSRLRRALAQTGGCDADRYLHVGSRITLDLDHVSIDAYRFTEHVAWGKLEDAHGKREVAREHYRKAERLYADALLSSEAVEPALASRVAEYGTHFEFVLTRLVEMSLENDNDVGTSYARRLAAVSTRSA